MQKEHGIIFSTDQRELWNTPTLTPPEVMSAAIPFGKEVQYLQDVNEDINDTPLHELLDEIRQDLDEVYGPKHLYGEAYFSGNLVGVDLINRFAPHLAYPLEKLVRTHVTRQNLKYFIHQKEDRFVTDIQQREYVDAVTRPHGRRVAELGPGYKDLIDRLSTAAFDGSDQRDIMNEGFRFIMTHAERSQTHDKKELARIVRLGGQAISLVDLNKEYEQVIDQERGFWV